MNREEYLNELKKYLKELPATDYENAMEYFTEYFEEVDGEKAVEELGTPKEAAEEIVGSLLGHGQEKRKDKKFLIKMGGIGALACLLCGVVLFSLFGTHSKNDIKPGMTDGSAISGGTVKGSGDETGNAEQGSYEVISEEIVIWRADDIRLSSISGIEAEFPYMDLQIRASEDEECHLSYELLGRKEENPLSWHMEGGILKLGEKDYQISLWSGQMTGRGKWMSMDSHVTLSVPSGTRFSKVSLHMEEGDVSLRGICCDEMGIWSEEGDVAVRESTVGKASVTAEEGDISLSGLSSGDEMNIRTEEGDIKASALKVGGGMKISTQEGDVSLSDFGSSGNIEIASECGDISVEIRENAAAGLEMVMDTGDGEIEISDLPGGTKRGGHYEKPGSGAPRMKGYTEEGDISVSLS